MPGMDGIELQRRIKQIDKNIITIMITAFASVDTSIQALKEGAFDYIVKPVDPDEMSHLIRNAVEQRRLICRKTCSCGGRSRKYPFHDEIVGASPALKKVMDKVATVAKTDSTVMIRGDSGTGKELIARAIHSNSNRRYFPIITINCGAYTEGLLESELFGHEKGSFTGALYRRRGKLEMADKGTIFLDEIGNIGMKMQMDLLRVIETRQFMRLGGDKLHDCGFSHHLRNQQRPGKRRARRNLPRRPLLPAQCFLPSRCRRCAKENPTSRCSRGIFVKKYAESMNKNVYGFDPGNPGDAVRAMSGRAMCANCAMLSSAPWSAPKAR